MCFLLYFIIINIGLQVAEYYSRRIGCYSINDASVNIKVTFNNNSGNVCLDYCSKTASTRYAGTSGRQCYCMSEVKGSNAPGWDCDMPCPDLTSDELCGGVRKITVYDGHKTISTTVEPTTSQPEYPPLYQSNSVTSTQSTETKFIPKLKEKHTTESSAKLFSVKSGRPPTLNSSSSNVSTKLQEEHMMSSSEILRLKICLIVCFAVTLCLLIMNNLVIYMCRKYKKSKKGSNKQAENYGYIRPVDVTDMINTSIRNNTQTCGEENSSNVYHYVGSSTIETHYTDLK